MEKAVMSQPSRTSRSRRRVALAVTLTLSVAAALVAGAPVPVLGAATFTVNKIGDQADLNLTNAKCDVSTKTGNQCTLRAAIQEANDTPGADTINFKITSASKVIAPATPLPPITEQVTVNGYSQSGAVANTQAVGAMPCSRSCSTGSMPARGRTGSRSPRTGPSSRVS
jgi:hypothetical protein